jgi:2-polyprenyl-3-methyl-5-hydroxy-6-metoxy-1,4-benzoquinol methylase
LAQRANIRLEIHGCDISGTAVEYAKKMAHKACADVDFFVQDAFEPSILNDYDIITNSLFIHHLDEENVVKFFRLASQRARHLMLISDLVRGSINLAMVSLASRLVSRSDVVHFDGPASVRAAFTPAEFRNFAERAGLHGAQVQNYFPCRMLFTWVRPHG